MANHYESTAHHNYGQGIFSIKVRFTTIAMGLIIFLIKPLMIWHIPIELLCTIKFNKFIFMFDDFIDSIPLS